MAKGLGGDHRASLSGYSGRFLDTAIAIVLGALVVSYIIYTTDIENRHRFVLRHPLRRPDVVCQVRGLMH